MKIVIAPDSYKGSISAANASGVIERAIKAVFPLVETIIKPMADGGEGTLDAIIASNVPSEKISFKCLNAKGESIQTNYLVIDNKTVIIEYAMIAGLTQLKETKSPEYYTSYGLGQALLDALDRGYKNIFIALGGSATNDVGIGMLSALGVCLFDEDNNKLGIYAKDIHTVNAINFASLDSRLHQANIKVIADVTNPLCGESGASYVYGPQKGLTSNQVHVFDQSFGHFAKLAEQALEEDFTNVAGAGAAGGLGFALLLLGAKIQSGAKTVGEIIQLEEAMTDVNLVITGEGKSDYQTLFGKAPAHVAELATKYHVPTILISGAVEDREQLNRLFSSCFSIATGPITLENSIQQTEVLLYEQTKQIMQLIKTQR